jgi:Zn-dependent peptidase ImmA (M78 family)
MVRRKAIRALVEELLRKQNIRCAPVAVEGVTKALGVDVHEEPAEDGLSGFLYRDRRKKRAIIGVNASNVPTRKRFTTAHELGHFLLHDFDDVHIDREFKVWLRSEASSHGTDDEEKEANFFAAEFLMPAKFLAKDIKGSEPFDILDDGVIEALAKQYDVSTQAMTFRLAYLGYIDQ